LKNNTGRPEAGACQAGAFLKSFVEGDTKWAHLDIAGTAIIHEKATGWGSRLLIEYVRQVSTPNKLHKEE
jgi:leucyl aminopeptidase